jgi:hypothetical protein
MRAKSRACQGGDLPISKHLKVWWLSRLKLTHLTSISQGKFVSPWSKIGEAVSLSQVKSSWLKHVTDVEWWRQEQSSSERGGVL